MPEPNVIDQVDHLTARAAKLDMDEGSTAGDAWLLTQLGREGMAAAATVAPTDVMFATASSESGDDEAISLGSRILRRLERQAHAILCGQDEQDKQDRAALGLSSDVFVSAVTVALTAGLSVGPQAAAVAAALIVRRLAKPTVEEACTYWSERLPD